MAEILSLESADMWWREVSYGFYHIEAEIPKGWYDMPPKGIPCWSLAALFEGVLPLEAEIHKQTDGHKIYYYVEACIPPRCKGKAIYLSTVRHENLVDACVEMIFTLKEKDLL